MRQPGGQGLQVVIADPGGAQVHAIGQEQVRTGQAMRQPSTQGIQAFIVDLDVLQVQLQTGQAFFLILALALVLIRALAQALWTWRQPRLRAWLSCS